MTNVVLEYLEEAPEYGTFPTVRALFDDVVLYASIALAPFEPNRAAIARELAAHEELVYALIADPA